LFRLAALLRPVAFQVAGLTESAAVFAFAALGFYHVTQTAAVRISPAAAVTTIAVLTIWGAFASAIYIPLAAWMVEANGWRPTLRILTMTAAVALVLGALAVDTRVEKAPRARFVVSELTASLRRPATRRFVIAVALIGMGVSKILVYQVPAMTTAGLSLGAASFWGCFRGFARLGGRLPLMPIVERLGIARSLRLAGGAITSRIPVLALAGTPWLAAIYALVAGFGILAGAALTKRSVLGVLLAGGAAYWAARWIA
jgi:predicted MFS family arabinose efflux permease